MNSGEGNGAECLVCRRVVFSGAYDWAKKTLQDHAKDARSYLYTREQLENADTYDQLWNAAQVHEGSTALKL